MRPLRGKGEQLLGDDVRGIGAGERLYHRGHTWVLPQEDGSVIVGMDELVHDLLGKPREVVLPPRGAQLTVGGTAARVRTQDGEYRIASPVDGTVIDAAAEDEDWRIRVRPREGACDTRHLLRGAEVNAWMIHESAAIRAADGKVALAALLLDP